MEDYQSFNLSIDPSIQDLADEVLNGEEVKHAENITETLFWDGHRDHAIKALQDLIGRTPKRPVYYLNNEIGRLPEETRDVIRYAGDFVDQIIKYCAHEKGSYFFKFQAFRHSLGPNLKKLKGVLPDDLIEKLRKFNDLIYVQAKHSWEVGSRPHLFSAAEAVLVCFIVKKFANDILPFSVEAQWYSENKMYNYHNTDPS